MQYSYPDLATTSTKFIVFLIVINEIAMLENLLCDNPNSRSVIILMVD